MHNFFYLINGIIVNIISSIFSIKIILKLNDKLRILIKYTILLYKRKQLELSAYAV